MNGKKVFDESHIFLLYQGLASIQYFYFLSVPHGAMADSISRNGSIAGTSSGML
jgi:hypothetical protein